MALPGDCVTAGNHDVPIQGYGNIDIEVQGPTGKTLFRLRDVAFCEHFAANLVSLRQLQRYGYWWDNRPNQNCLRTHHGRIICKIFDRHDQYVLEYIPGDKSKQSFLVRRNTFNSWTGRRPAGADAKKWHLRLGHPGPQALEHLVNCSTGARIKGITTTECDDCAVSKAKRQVSRKPRNTENAPGIRLAVDFHDFQHNSQGKQHVMLITDRWSGYIWDFYLADRGAETMIEVFNTLFGILERRFRIKPSVIECDNEIYKRRLQVRQFLESLFIVIEPSAPDTQAQNGGAERSGGIIKNKARAMRSGARLPVYLWVEVFKAAVYLYNRTPKYIYKWQSPYDRFYTFVAERDGVAIDGRKPDQRHLRVYGCKAFAMTREALRKSNRLERMNPRAWIGYLVGYQSTNIYRIWNPKLGTVISTRDVTFNEDECFNGDLNQMRDDLRHMSREELVAILRDIEEPSNQDDMQEDVEGEDDIVYGAGNGWNIGAIQRVDERSGDERTEVPSARSVVDGSGRSAQTAAVSLPEVSEALPAFDDCPSEGIRTRTGMPLAESGSQEPSRKQGQGHILPNSGAQQRQDADCRETSRSPLPDAFAREPPESAKEADTQVQHYPTPARSESFPAALMAYCFGDANEVLQAEDETIQRSDIDVWKAAFAAGRHAMPIGVIDNKQIDKAKFLRSLKRPERRSGPSGTLNGQPVDKDKFRKLLAKAVSPHRRQMPALPRSHHEVLMHPMESEFLQAEAIHLQSHVDMKTYKEIPKDDPSARGEQVLDCMWVYTYKFDKHGYFQKCKARLVVRGDQQAKSIHEDTYASTLAGRSFRILMAIAARFDLESVQYDAVNAFVNAKINRDIFMRMPPGYRKPGRILKLQRALYGLRCSPLLWQKELTNTLEELGFEKVPHEPCCMMKNGIIIFFYVDDIVLAYKKGKETEAQNLADRLKQKYKLTGGNQLQWFLGIEITRDRDQKLIWLSQSAYIDKIANLAGSVDRRLNVPMSGPELLPYEGRASAASIRKYQRKIGSLLYAAVITRPDIAFAVSRLARFNMNPSNEHHDAADKVLQYLTQTRTLALQLGGGDEFLVASDASFADNSIDRKSSQAYVMKLFGGTIAWRANKQDTVTTSTTEAELLAVSQAAKESMFVSRLLKELSIRLDDQTIHIQCDNQQTIKVVNKEIGLLQTKLRHVDVHNHWLRQEVQNKTISVEYMPSSEMMADGLTKALTTQRFRESVARLGLVDIATRLQQRQLNEMDETLQQKLNPLEM
ncbi:polyprotein [Pochonia chlamydosporia 170]|uniref:Polyprotein n=1 Tax=Pochonia chlamydosporia 170 TaxID=1380566 RepID=A0A179EW94_METCM|nr:polyprotein [Pochonia chlamydosporia 170]OAQ57457.2 polyprotein [Pochonia chlamydosporia 170]